MYGKWLFKEIKTEYGLCKVEIYRKNFTDTAIEIGALESNSLTLAMENLGNITDPIGKSVCSFSIIDTDQIDYDEFFTPDATAYMVVVSTKTEGGAYVTRWSGYITPDFFAENLSYRTPISISARDNIGYLNDVDFDLDASTITVRGLIEAAFNRIAEDYPMQIVFATQKQTAEGVLAIDATISTMLLREGSWYEAIETVLHDLGLQMRWVDNNTIAVLDLSQIPEYYATQAFNFVDASGYREILPAWRELAQEQDYGLRENFFEGQINNANLRFVKEETLNLPLSMGGVTGNPVMKYYAPSNWGVAGSTLTINTDNYKYIGSYGQEPSGQGGRIYFTGVQKDAANLPQNYMSYRQPVYVSQRGKMSIAFNAFNSLLATNKISAETLQVYNPADRFMDFATGDSLQLGLKINVFLHVGTKTFILGDTWEEITGAETNSLYFTLDKVGQLGANGTTTPTEQEITIDVNTIPYNGELELRIYGFCIHEKTNLQEDAGLATYDWLKMVSYIDDVRYSYERELATGQGARTEIAPLHNVKESKSYKFGQVPVYAGGINAYAGGLYNASKNMESMMLFQRNANATSYNLLELVGREVIHFNKKNYNKLSGTIRNLAKEPLMFNRLFVRNGKRYAPFAYSLNIISNQMEITTMQEVENYVTESFSEINSAVTTGGAIVSAGNNTVMQYSQDAGNTKRIYELTAATEEEKKDTWVMIDGTAFPEARKINVKDLEGLNEEQVEAYLTEKKYATQSWVKGITDDLETDIANRVLVTNFEKLEDAVDSNYKSISNIASTIPTIESNISTLATRVSSAESVITTIQSTYVDKASAQEISGVKTFKNGLKIGEAELVWDSSNKALKIVGSAYITKDLSFGGYQAPGGGGTSGGGIVTIKVNGQEYTSQNGIVTLPNYPSLAGYATESWVGNNYLGLGGGTITGWLTIKSNGYPLIEFKAGDITRGYYGFSGTGIAAIWDTKDWQTLIHSGNIGSQIVEGVFAGSNIGDANTVSFTDSALRWFSLIPSTTSNIPTYTAYQNGLLALPLHINGITAQWYFSYNKKPYYRSSQTSNWNEIAYVTDNVASADYATSAGDAKNLKSTSSTYDYIVGIGSTSTFYDWTQSSDGYFYGLQMESPDANYKMQIARMLWSAGLFWRECNGSSTYGDWVTIVDGNNISLYNAGSATKLQTARTIWGQSFDGTANVSGNLNLGYNAIIDGELNRLLVSDGSNLFLGTADISAYTTYITGAELRFRYGSSSETGLTLNRSGNVLIGATSDNGAKLQVNGDVTAKVLVANKNGDGGSGAGLSLYYSKDFVNTYGIHMSQTSAYGTKGDVTGNWATYFSMTDVTYGGWIFRGLYGNVVAISNTSGNLTVTGDITFGSDVRYKNKLTDVEIDLATIANAPLFNYRWNNREDDREHLGTTAQYWYNTAFKNAVVPTNDEKLWTMSYSEIAMGNTIVLAREQIKIKSEVEQLKEKVRQLEDELDKYRRVA